MWDTSKPDGTPRKLLDVSRLRDLGWSARIPLREGIAATVAWYRATPTTCARSAKDAARWSSRSRPRVAPQAPHRVSTSSTAEPGRQLPELIIPAPTVTPVASSIRMNEPVVRFFE